MAHEKQTDIHNPNFDQQTLDQRHVSSDGEARFSLWLPPSTEEHFAEHVARTARENYFNIDDFRDEQAENLERIDREYAEPKVLENPDGTKLEIRLVNRDAEKGIIAFLSSWSVDSDWDNSRGVIEAIALKFPDHGVAFINTPGMSQSSKVTKERERSMMKTGSYYPMADQIAGALKTDPNLKFDILFGYSEGGRISVPLSDELDVPLVVTIDPPGLDDQFFPKFAYDFAVKEGKAQNATNDFSPDKLMVELGKGDAKRLSKDKHVLGRQLLERAWTMSRAGLVGDIKKTLDNGNRRIIDYRGTASTIGNSESAARLAEQIPGYETVILKGMGHAAIPSNPYSAVALLEQAVQLDQAKK